MDGNYANAGAAVAQGQLRPATPDEMHKLKQSQVTSEPKPAAPSTSQLIKMLVDASVGVYLESNGLICQTVGDIPARNIPPSEFSGFKGDLVFAIRHIHEACGNLSNLRKLTGVLLLCLFLGGVAIAQKKAAPAPPVNDLTVNRQGITLNVVGKEKDNIACGNSVQPTTGFTECEMLRISNYVAQINALEQEVQARIKPVTDAGNEFIGKVVAIDRNKGKQYESPSQQFPLGRLVPIPPPPPTPPNPAATAPPVLPPPAQTHPQVPPPAAQ